MRTTPGPRDSGMKQNEHAHGPNVAFESMCPKCAQVQPQRGFDRNSLLRLLSRGYPVEAYCAMCDEFWSISAKERAVLVAAAVAGGGTFVC
jgi:hypothetical protein